MLSQQMSLPKTFFFFLCRRFCSSTNGPTKKRRRRFPEFSNIRSEYKSRVMVEAQTALREYLHDTKSLPFFFADQIANNSVFSLSKLLRKIQFSAPTFSMSFRSLLRYEPINEFEFFLESIGIDHNDVHRYLPPKQFFLSEVQTVLGTACALLQFGFPWNRLGKLYEEEASVFRKPSDALINRLSLLRERGGIDSLCLVGICLAYPQVLSLDTELGSDFDSMLYDLKRVFAELDECTCVAGNVDSWYELCRKVRIFHDLGCEKGKVGELICENGDSILLQCPEAVLVQKVEYFSRFGASKVDVGLFLLKNPKILSCDLETAVISVSGVLEHFGLRSEELRRVRHKYPHVFGMNRMANLPRIAMASDLHIWCFDRIKSSNGQFLLTYNDTRLDEDEELLVTRKSLSRLRACKLDFLKGIGFGENELTIKLVNNLHGGGAKLRERFNFFLGLGIKHSELCLMIIRAPHILCQNPKKLEEKVKFLRRNMECPLEFLIGFPRFLYYDLDTRIKPRHRLYAWLRELDLYTKKYSVSHMLKSNEKSFVERLFRIHPAAPKHYFERFSANNELSVD